MVNWPCQITRGYITSRNREPEGLAKNNDGGM